MSNYVRRHLKFGFWSLLFFATLGFLLEALHGFKVRGYIGAASETRRLMWTLAHAHGTLIGVLHLAFAWTCTRLTGARGLLASASRMLLWAGVVLPVGFVLGGVRFYAGDPGLGIALVPVGAVLLICAALTTARAAGRH